MAAATLHIGLDFGGTNIKWVIVEHAGSDWRTVDEGSIKTDRSGDDAAVVAQLAGLADEVHERAEGAVDSLGLAVPGLYIPETGVVTFLTNVPGDWSATPVGHPLADATGLPTAIINDARAFGLAELRYGAGRDVRSFVGLTLGTGIGGVFTLDDQVVRGYRGQAGEFGHQTIDPDGPLCGCGDRGCVEAFTRGDVTAARCGQPTMRAAVAAARDGDETAIVGLRETGRYLGIGLANAVTIVTPERIILGGGWSRAGDLIIEPIREELRKRVITTPIKRVDVVLAELGTWAGAIGAAVHSAEVEDAAVQRPGGKPDG